MAISLGLAEDAPVRRGACVVLTESERGDFVYAHTYCGSIWATTLCMDPHDMGAWEMKQTDLDLPPGFVGTN